MSDFWTARGFVNPNGGTLSSNMPPLHDFIAAEQNRPPEAIQVALPQDYPARLRAVELAVQLTMSKFDGGQQRVMDRARAFHSFLIGRQPYEMMLTKAAYEAAADVFGDLQDPISPELAEQLAEDAVNAAWSVMLGEANV
jgi:hypothetical protein